MIAIVMVGIRTKILKRNPRTIPANAPTVRKTTIKSSPFAERRWCCESSPSTSAARITRSVRIEAKKSLCDAASLLSLAIEAIALRQKPKNVGEIDYSNHLFCAQPRYERVKFVQCTLSKTVYLRRFSARCSLLFWIVLAVDRNRTDKNRPDAELEIKSVQEFGWSKRPQLDQPTLRTRRL